MSDEYKDYLAISVLVAFLGVLMIYMIWVTGWLFPIILGVGGMIGLLVWALDRVADF